MTEAHWNALTKGCVIAFCRQEDDYLNIEGVIVDHLNEEGNVVPYDNEWSKYDCFMDAVELKNVNFVPHSCDMVRQSFTAGDVVLFTTQTETGETDFFEGYTIKQIDYEKEVFLFASEYTLPFSASLCKFDESMINNR